MTLTPQLCAEIIRQRLNLSDDSQAARIINMIPQALKSAGRKLAADPFTRSLVTTNKDSTLLRIGNQGIVPLNTSNLDTAGFADAYDSYQLLMEYWDKGSIYYLPTIPMAATQAHGTLTVQDAALVAATGSLTIHEPSVQATGYLQFVQPMPATGSIVFRNTPDDGETIQVNHITFTFRPLPPPTTVPVAAPFRGVYYTSDRNYNAASLAAALAADPSGNLTSASYASSGPITNITYNTNGTVGNGFALASSNHGNVTVSMSHLTNGTDGVIDGEVLFVDGYPFVWVNAVPTTPDSIEPPTTYLPISTSVVDNLQTLVNALVASTNALLNVATYRIDQRLLRVFITYRDAGYVGNSYTLADSSEEAILASDATLTGGLGGITEGSTDVIHGVTFTFSNTTYGDTFFQYDNDDPAVTADLMVEVLTNSTNPSITAASYERGSEPDPTAIGGLQYFVLITYNTPGTGGNSYDIADSSDGAVTASGAHLSGGTGGVAAQTIAINTVSYVFDNSPGATHIAYDDGDPTVTAANIAAKLTASSNPLITQATYSVVEAVVTILHKNYGTLGNTYALANSTGNGVVASGTTLTGGTGGVETEDDTIFIDQEIDYFQNLDLIHVAVPAGGVLPDPLDIDTPYYIINRQEIDGGLLFELSDYPDGSNIVNLAAQGWGLMTIIKRGGSGQPLQETNLKAAALPNYLAAEFDYYYIRDNNVCLLPIEDVSPVGSIALEVPFYPLNLSALPDSQEAEKLFLQELMNIVAVPVQES